MSETNLLTETALRHFREGYNCAQSVLMTMTEHWNCKNELIPKVANAFGGGIARCGSVCGAVTGGIMAIGIKYGTNEPSAEKQKVAYELAAQFYRQFEKNNKTVMCRELIGFDLSDLEQRKKAREQQIFQTKCPAFVKSAVEILASLHPTIT